MKHRRRGLALLILCIFLGGFAALRANRDALADWSDARKLSPEQFLCDRLDRHAQRIDLLPYRLEPDDFLRLWNKTQGEHPELFHVSPGYTYASLGDRVLSVFPEYGLTDEEARDAQAFYQHTLETVAARVEPDWTELETALYLHDWLALHARYDDSLERYTAYDLFTTGEGVCQAYAHAYMALLRQCGMECRYVTSEEMNHAWVIVSVDHEWYNVDVTHDDPVYDRLGHVQHDFFLKSDAALAGTHHGGDAPEPCASTRFDDPVWDRVDTAFVPVDGAFYCISGNQICRWEGGSLTPLYTIQDRWYTSGAKTAYWEGCFSALAADDGGLLFNTPTAVNRYDLTAGTVTPLWEYRGEGSLFGFADTGGAVTGYVAADPNENGRTVPLTPKS